MKALYQEQIWLDPVTAEVSPSRGTLVLAGLPALGTITNVWQAGQMTAIEAVQVCHLLLLFHQRFNRILAVY